MEELICLHHQLPRDKFAKAVYITVRLKDIRAKAIKELIPTKNFEPFSVGMKPPSNEVLR